MGAAQDYTYSDVIEKIRELPALPTVVTELSRLIADPMSSTQQIQNVMEQDTGITAKVLQLANSAYYAIPGGVSTLARAIAYLGFDTVHQLVLATSVFNALKVEGESKFDFQDFWRHSIGVASVAEVIANEINHPTPSELFTCGLLHDMGKLALCKIDLEYLESVCLKAHEEKLTFFEAEMDAGILKHTKLGFILAENWKLPQHIQYAVTYHHERNPEHRQGISDEMNQYVDITVLANLLTHAVNFGNSGYHKIPAAPKEVVARLGFDIKDLPDLVLKFKEPLSKVSNFLNILNGD